MILTIFIVASDNEHDTIGKETLIKHITPLVSQHKWELCSEILLGQDVEQHMIKQSREADLIIIILSVDFITSPYYDFITDIVVQRHQQKTAATVGVLFRSCNWKHTPYKDCIIIPHDQETLAKSSEGVDAWYEKVMNAIEQQMIIAEQAQVIKNLKNDNTLLKQEAIRLRNRITNLEKPPKTK